MELPEASQVKNKQSDQKAPQKNWVHLYTETHSTNSQTWSCKDERVEVYSFGTCLKDETNWPALT